MTAVGENPGPGPIRQRGVRRIEARFPGTSGARLFRRAWIPPDPRRVLAVVHGFAEHSGRYENFGAWFADRGCAVHAYDQRGHGYSSGRRGHLRSFAHYLDDLSIFLETVRREQPELPLCLVGHSMGGLVVASYLRERRPEIACAVTSGALLDHPKGLSAARVWIARVLRWIAPRLRVPGGVDPEGLSRDPNVVRDYIEDPLVFSSATTSLGAELIDAVRRIQAGGDVCVPLLMLHGGEDSLCPVDGSRRFFETLRVAGSDLKVYPALRHEIFNEPESEAVFSDLLEWIRAQERSLSEVRIPSEQAVS